MSNLSERKWAWLCNSQDSLWYSSCRLRQQLFFIFPRVFHVNLVLLLYCFFFHFTVLVELAIHIRLFNDCTTSTWKREILAFSPWPVKTLIYQRVIVCRIEFSMIQKSPLTIGARRRRVKHNFEETLVNRFETWISPITIIAKHWW